MSVRASLCVEAMVRGYHTYQRVWTAVVGEELHVPPWQRKTVNPLDPFAVAVLKDEAISFVCTYKSIVTSLASLLHATCLASSPDLVLFCVHVRVSRMHHEIKFRDFYFCMLHLLVTNAKFCTLRRFPAIRYSILYSVLYSLVSTQFHVAT